MPTTSLSHHPYTISNFTSSAGSSRRVLYLIIPRALTCWKIHKINLENTLACRQKRFATQHCVHDTQRFRTLTTSPAQSITKYHSRFHSSPLATAWPYSLKHLHCSTASLFTSPRTQSLFANQQRWLVLLIPLEPYVEIGYWHLYYLTTKFSLKAVATSRLHSTPSSACNPLNQRGKSFTIKFPPSLNEFNICRYEDSPFTFQVGLFCSFCVQQTIFIWLKVSWI